jgi:Glycosyltransferase family 9 (heptosyltransferase)
MGYGDELLAAGHAQTVYDRDPSRRVAICDRRGRSRWSEIWPGNPIIATPAEVAAGEPVHRIRNATGCRPYIKYPFTTATGVHFTGWRARDHRPRLYLDASELGRGEAIARQYRSFVVVEPSPILKSNPNKIWPAESFARLVGMYPEIAFVQLAHPEARILCNVATIPVRTFREACGILRYAAAYVGPEGGLHHAAAALGVPAVVIFGGCMSVEATGYPDQINLADEGPETPCGRWLPCDHCRAAMAAITVETVAGALETVLAAEVVG